MSTHDAVHQQRYDILRPLVTAEVAKFNFDHIDIEYGLEFKNLHELVDEFAWCILRLHFDTFDSGFDGFGRITISPATGRVTLVRNIRYIDFRKERKDV